MATTGAIGMMHEGYFVGRKELISWVQQYFQPNFNKVEECASGVVYCQVIDSIYPGAVPMSKVKMQAKTEVDFIHNFKILQTAFSKKKIDRYIDVDKLTKKSFQTNMEFLQFMKCYWYMPAPNGEGMPAAALVENQPPEAVEKPPAAQKPKPKADPSEPKMGGGAKRAAPGATAATRKPVASSEVAASAASSEAQQQQALEITELKMSVENLERERDFYYSKLREVEVLCQTMEDQKVPFLRTSSTSSTRRTTRTSLCRRTSRRASPSSKEREEARRGGGTRVYASYRRRRTLEFCSRRAGVASASSVCVVRVCPAVERGVRWRCEGVCVKAR